MGKKADDIPRVRKGMFAWMIAQGDGILLPDLWNHSRRDAIDKAVRHQGHPWHRLQARGWSAHKVYIATIPRGFKIDVRLRINQ